MIRSQRRLLLTRQGRRVRWRKPTKILLISDVEDEDEVGGGDAADEDDTDAKTTPDTKEKSEDVDETSHVGSTQSNRSDYSINLAGINLPCRNYLLNTMTIVKQLIQTVGIQKKTATTSILYKG